MYLEDRTVRLQLWDTAGQVKRVYKKVDDRILILYTGTISITYSQLY